MYVVPVIAQHNGMALRYCCLQRSFLCRSFVITELESLYDEESARALGVLDVDE